MIHRRYSYNNIKTILMTIIKNHPWIFIIISTLLFHQYTVFYTVYNLTL